MSKWYRTIHDYWVDLDVKFQITWFCPCGESHPTPSCGTCGVYINGWLALDHGWRVSVLPPLDGVDGYYKQKES